MINYEIWLDMDEVLVNLSEHIIDIYNREFNDNFDYRKNTDWWWGSVKKADRQYFIDLLHREGVFFNSKPMDGSIDFVNKLLNEKYKVYIITYPQFTSQYCCQEKINWIRKYLPKFDISNLIMCQDKSLLAKPNRILLDDAMQNLEEWHENNGISVCFDHIWNSDWNGLKVCDFKEFYSLIREIEK